MAREALDLMVQRSDRAEDSVLRAGMSAELLLRAVVANVSPAFVMGGRDEARRAAAMIRAHLGTELDVAELLAQKSATFDFVRIAAKEIVPDLGPLFSSLDSLMNARNAAAHLYVADAAALRGNLTVLAKIVSVLLAPLGMTGESFWGPHRDLAEVLIEENATAIRASVALKQSQARLSFAELRAGLYPGDAEDVLATIERRGLPFVSAGVTVFSTECPVCARQAELWVRAADYLDNPNQIQIQWDPRGEEPTGALVPQEVAGVRLVCPVCQLSLTEEEVRGTYPELADGYELEPRLMSLDEYDDYIVLQDPT